MLDQNVIKYIKKSNEFYLNDELLGIIIIKIFFRLGDLDIVSIDWGNGYYVYCVKIIYLKLNSVLVVLYYIFED